MWWEPSVLCSSSPVKARVVSQTLRLLLSIVAVPRPSLFWTEISDVAPGICRSHSPSFRVTAPSAPITTETFTLCIFSSSSFSPMVFFSSFLCSVFRMLLSPEIAASITTAGRLAITRVSIWSWLGHSPPPAAHTAFTTCWYVLDCLGGISAQPAWCGGPWPQSILCWPPVPVLPGRDKNKNQGLQMKTSLLANCGMFKRKAIWTQEGPIYNINEIKKKIFINIHYWINKPSSD